MIRITLSLMLLFSLIQNISALTPSENKVKGLEKRYRHQLAESMKLPLAERLEQKASIENAKKAWQTQLQFLELDIPETPVEMPTKKLPNSKPSWYSAETTAKDFVWKNIPEVTSWHPNWGRSQRKRRLLKKEKPFNDEPILLSQLHIDHRDQKTHDKKRFNEKLVIREYLPDLEQQILTERHFKKYSKTKAFHLKVPQALSQENWWLWERHDENSKWIPTLRGSGNPDIERFSKKDGYIAFIFTPELKHPGKNPENYAFFVDTRYPKIISFSTNKLKNKLVFNWEIQEAHPHLDATTLSIYDQNDKLLLSRTQLNLNGSYILEEQLSRLAKKAFLSSKDLAGNFKEESINL